MKKIPVLVALAVLVSTVNATVVLSPPEPKPTEIKEAAYLPPPKPKSPGGAVTSETWVSLWSEWDN